MVARGRTGADGPPRGRSLGVRPGPGLDLLTDSSDVTHEVAERLRRHDAGLARVLTLRDAALPPEDLMDDWADDEAVGAAAVCLRGPPPGPLGRAARTFARRKPLLTLLPSRAARPWSPAGAVRCTDVADLADTGLLLGSQPPPRGGRLAVVADSTRLADGVARAAGRAGLAVTALSAACERRLALVSDRIERAENPVSVDPVADPVAAADVVCTLLDSTEVDAVLMALARTPVAPSRVLLHELGVVVRGVGVPVVVGAPHGAVPTLGPPPVPVLTSSSAVRAIAHAAERAHWLARVTNPGEAGER